MPRGTELRDLPPRADARGLMSTARARGVELPMSEAAFQRRVIETAKLYGWRTHHARPARTQRGWRTPIEGHAGFPDLVFVRRGRLILAEVKSELGRLRLDQETWIQALRAVAGIEVYVWRPSDWPAVLEALR